MKRGFADRALYALLLVDAVLLAVVELLYLPLRLDGELLPRLGDVPLPLSIVVAIVTTPLLVLQAGKLAGKRLAAALPLVCWLLVIMVLGLSGPGGDLVLVDDWRALVLVAGGALPGAFVLGGRLVAQPAVNRG